MKKNLTLILSLSLISLAASKSFAASEPELKYTYQCGSAILKVLKQDDKFIIKMSSPAADGSNHIVNIASKAETLETAKAAFGGGDTTVDDNTDSESKLPKGSVSFMGFHYPNGDMYVTAEDDTNEEGYTFAAESSLLSGAQIVKVADLFWSDFSATDVTNYDCARLK
ncbi:MAG: hypothetical protein ACXVAX_09670 [Pseudobdellovibrio sp.]